jgi:hypothetical protein
MLEYRQTEQYRKEQIEIAERQRMIRELHDDHDAVKPSILDTFRLRRSNR